MDLDIKPTKERILLVDDNKDDRFFIMRILTGEGYEVVEASSGCEALECLHQQASEFHLFITDIIMPEMDGTTLVRQIRKFLPEIKVIFVSGVVRDRSQLMEIDSALFMTKDDRFSQLIPKVNEALAPREISAIKSLFNRYLG